MAESAANYGFGAEVEALGETTSSGVSTVYRGDDHDAAEGIARGLDATGVRVVGAHWFGEHFVYRFDGMTEQEISSWLDGMWDRFAARAAHNTHIAEERFAPAVCAYCADETGHEDAPDAAATAVEGENQNPRRNQNVAIMTDIPEGFESWPDIREVMPKGGLVTSDAIVMELERRSGRKLVHRVEHPGRGPHVFVHPSLVDAARAWYAALPDSFDAHLGTLDEIPAIPASSSEDEPTGPEQIEEPTPCSLFEWCDGHSSMSPESDGAHFTTAEVGAFEGGEPKALYIYRYLPTDVDGDEALWSFSMPEGGEWSFGPDEVDVEIDRAIADLERARHTMKTFLITHAANESVGRGVGQ